MPTIVYGLPAYRGMVSVAHVELVAGLQRVATTHGGTLLIAHADSCSIDWSRNSLLAWSLRVDADWLLTVDADTHTRNVGAVDRMLGSGAKAGAAIIAAPVKARRGFSGSYNLAVLENGVERNLNRHEFEGIVRPVDRIGTGFMAINCKWIKANLAAPWFESKQLMIDGVPAWIGEDYAFCEKVKSAGGQILVDGRFEPEHTP